MRLDISLRFAKVSASARRLRRAAFASGALALLAALALAFCAPRAASAHKLRHSLDAVDSLLVWRGGESFAPGRFIGATLTSAGEIALAEMAPASGNAAASARQTPDFLYGEYLSPAVPLPGGATEFLPAWNFDFDPAAAGFAIELRFRWEPGAAAGTTTATLAQPPPRRRQPPEIPPHLRWSAWYHLGADGLVDDPTSAPLHLEDAAALVDDDYLVAASRAVAVQWRARLWRSAEAPAAAGPRLRMLTLAASDPNAAPGSALPAAERARRRAALLETAPDRPPITLENFPWQTQILGSKIDNLICCPVSVTMVRNYYGDPAPPLEVAARCFDRRVRIYGCWPRATQVLSEAVGAAWIERFRAVEEAEPFFAKGIPVIVSLKIRKGDIKVDPEYATSGHIIVLCGVDAGGRIIIADPGCTRRHEGYRALDRDDIERIWIQNGGIGLIAAPPAHHLPRSYTFGR